VPKRDVFLIGAEKAKAFLEEGKENEGTKGKRRNQENASKEYKEREIGATQG